jgi:hypothetical protein
VIPVAVLLICLALAIRGNEKLRKLTNGLQGALLIFIPVTILIFGNAFLALAGIINPGFEPNVIEKEIPPRDPNNHLHRVIWVIFDEFDQVELTERPPNIQLPELEDLKSKSLSAANAFSPQVWTHISVPALLTGKTVRSVKDHGPDKLELSFYSGEPASEITKTETIFNDVAKLSGHSAAAGWGHPYPRLFRDTLSTGYWVPQSSYHCTKIGECVLVGFANSFEDLPTFKDLSTVNLFLREDQIPFVRNNFLYSFPQHAQANNFVQDRARQIVSNDRIDFAFLHFPIPHGPYIKRNNQEGATYLEALGSVDETVTQLREAMQENGTWDKTTLIISSDHWWRYKFDPPHDDDWKPILRFALGDTRIPFLIKPEGPPNALKYEKPFNTVITRYLIDAIMSGEVSTSEDIAHWLDVMALERPDLMNFHPCSQLENAAPLDLHADKEIKVRCE